MAKFEVYDKCDFEQESISMEDVLKILKKSLSKHFDYYKIYKIKNEWTLKINKSNLSEFWERAITTAEIRLKVNGNTLIYSAEGEVRFGWTPWIWLLLGFLTKSVFFIGGVFFNSDVFFGVFLIYLIEFILCRDKPKTYIKEAFEAAKFKLCEGG